MPRFSHSEIRAVFIGLMLTMFLGALDQTIVATALPTIGRHFGDIENLAWVVTAYLLTATAVTPLYGKLSDFYGRRALLLVGITIFVVGSVACALAPSLTALIFARGLQGLGGGGLLSLSQTIIGDVVSPRERGRYQGYIGTVFACASIGGPVLGGVLAEHLHWSLIFWINLPLGVAAFLISNATLKRLSQHRHVHRIDFVGAGLMMAAAVALLLALTWGGTRYPWTSPPILALLIGSVALWVLFAIQLMTKLEPFLPVHVLANPVVRAGTFTAACSMGTLIGLTIYVPLYFDVVLGLSASESGLALIPLVGAVVVAATMSGQIMARVRHYKRMPYIGLSLSIAGLLFIAWKPTGLPLPVVAAALGSVGFGIGSVFPVTTVAVQNAVAHQDLGTATGTMNFFRQLGGALIVAAFGAVVLGGLGAPEGAADVTALIAEAGAHGVNLAPVFSAVFCVAAAILGLGLVSLLVMEERPLRGPAKPAAIDTAGRVPPSAAAD